MINPFLEQEQPPRGNSPAPRLRNPYLEPYDPNVNPVQQAMTAGQPQPPLQSYDRVDSKLTGIPTGADFMTQRAASWPHDPLKKIEVYAKARGISPDKYGIDPTGEIYFTAPDGKQYFETAPYLGRIEKLAGELTGAEALPTLAGVLGSGLVGGPIKSAALAGLGGAVGEGIRQVVANDATGEQLPLSERAAYMGTAGITEGTGALMGLLGPKMYNRLLVGGRRNILPRAMTEAERIQAVTNAPATQQALQLADQFEIPLRPAQASRSGSLLAQEGLVRGQPQFEDRFVASQAAQEAGANRAWDRLMEQISRITSREQAGNRLVQASKDWWARADRARTSATAPMFQNAFNTAPPIDTGPVISLLDQKIKGATLGSERRKLLERMRLGLMEEVQDPQGATVRVPRTDLAGLHEWKMNLDKWTETPPDFLPHGLDKFMKKDLGEVKDAFFGITDTVSPEYRAARQRFASLSPPIDRFEKSQVGRLSRLEGDAAANAHRMLFNSVMSNPESVARYRRWISRQDPEAWNSGVRTYLEDIFNDIRRDAGQESFNLPKRLHDRVFGTPKQREIMAAAMSPEQYRTMEDFMFVLDRAAAGWNIGSQTWPRKMAEDTMRRNAVPGPVRALGAAVQLPANIPLNASKLLENMFFGGYQNRLAEALLDPRMAASIANIKRLTPGGEKFAFLSAQLLSDIAAGKFARDIEQSAWSENPAGGK